MLSARRLLSSLFLTTIVGMLPQIVKAECPDCSDCCKDKCRCCRKIVIKHPRFAGPAPAPVGFAVPSAAIMPVHIPTFAFAAAPVAPTASAGLTADELREFRAVLAQNRTANAASAAGSTLKCDDPCGDILQLRKDLNALIVVTDKLSLAVEKIANNPAIQQPAPGK
jgi:hypothetical protein